MIATSDRHHACLKKKAQTQPRRHGQLEPQSVWHGLPKKGPTRSWWEEDVPVSRHVTKHNTSPSPYAQLPATLGSPTASLRGSHASSSLQSPSPSCLRGQRNFIPTAPPPPAFCSAILAPNTRDFAHLETGQYKNSHQPMHSWSLASIKTVMTFCGKKAHKKIGTLVTLDLG